MKLKTRLKRFEAKSHAVLADIEQAIARGVNIEFSAFGPGRYHVRFMFNGKPVAHWYPNKESLWLGKTPIRHVPGCFETVQDVLVTLKQLSNEARIRRASS